MVKVTCSKLTVLSERPCLREHNPNMKTQSLRIKKVMTNVKDFQKKVKGHGQGHMFKMYGTFGKALSKGTLMPNMKALSLTVKKIYKMLKFADGQTDRVITIGHPPSGGTLIKVFWAKFDRLQKITILCLLDCIRIHLCTILEGLLKAILQV